MSSMQNSIDVELRVKLELGERKTKSKEKGPRRTKSLPSPRKSRSKKSSPRALLNIMLITIIGQEVEVQVRREVKRNP